MGLMKHTTMADTKNMPVMARIMKFFIRYVYYSFAKVMQIVIMAKE